MLGMGYGKGKATAYTHPLNQIDIIIIIKNFDPIHEESKITIQEGKV